MRARYYNIDIKRFINQDILTGSIDSSKSLNRYAYVEGNPISYLDPFGLKKTDTELIHLIATTASLAFQVASITLAFTGHPVLSEICGYLADVASFYNIYWDFYDLIHAETMKERDLAFAKARDDILLLLFNTVVNLYGTVPGMDVNLKEIPQEIMEIGASIFNYIINAFAVFVS